MVAGPTLYVTAREAGPLPTIVIATDHVVAARRVCARLGPSATVVTIMCDSGLRYLSTDVFR